jgi:hypothetical protein
MIGGLYMEYSKGINHEKLLQMCRKLDPLKIKIGICMMLLQEKRFYEKLSNEKRNAIHSMIEKFLEEEEN